RHARGPVAAPVAVVTIEPCVVVERALPAEDRAERRNGARGGEGGQQGGDDPWHAHGQAISPDLPVGQPQFAGMGKQLAPPERRALRRATCRTWFSTRFLPSSR